MSLADIRAKLLAQDNRTQQNKVAGTGDNAVYPFWDMADNTSTTVRFLPDADPSNSFFWVERSIFKFPFIGVKGQADSNKEYIVQVPCMEMYGENCPVLAEVRSWYKDESLKEVANKYWKKRTYLFQGFVRNSTMVEENSPENSIRRFVISPQIYTIIKSSLMDPEIDELPTDYLRGLDFRISKTKSGEHSAYTTSGWARKESALTPDEMEVIETYGLFNLREYLPKKPTDAEKRIIMEMFEASYAGKPYDAERWGAYYKPWGLNTNSSKNSSSESNDSSIVSAKVNTAMIQEVSDASTDSSPPWTETVESNPSPVVATESTTKVSKADDILKMIRAKQNKTS